MKVKLGYSIFIKEKWNQKRDCCVNMVTMCVQLHLDFQLCSQVPLIVRVLRASQRALGSGKADLMGCVSTEATVIDSVCGHKKNSPKTVLLSKNDVKLCPKWTIKLGPFRSSSESLVPTEQ